MCTENRINGKEEYGVCVRARARSLVARCIFTTERRTPVVYSWNSVSCESCVHMTLILIKLFNLEPFNSSLWICKQCVLRCIWIALAQITNRPVRTDTHSRFSAHRFRFDVMFIVFAKCIAKSLTVKGFPFRSFIIRFDAVWWISMISSGTSDLRIIYFCSSFNAICPWASANASLIIFCMRNSYQSSAKNATCVDCQTILISSLRNRSISLWTRNASQINREITSFHLTNWITRRQTISSLWIWIAC